MIVLVVPEYVLGYTQSVYVYATWVPSLVVLVVPDYVPGYTQSVYVYTLGTKPGVLVTWVPNLVVLVTWVCLLYTSPSPRD